MTLPIRHTKPKVYKFHQNKHSRYGLNAHTALRLASSSMNLALPNTYNSIICNWSI